MVVSPLALNLRVENSSKILLGTFRFIVLEKNVIVMIWGEAIRWYRKFKTNFMGSSCHLALLLVP